MDFAFWGNVPPELEQCVSCGSHGPLVAFDLDQGGVLCRNCRRGAPITDEALLLLRRLLGGELAAVLREPVSRATHEVDDLAVRAMEHHLERRLRSVEVLGQV